MVDYPYSYVVQGVAIDSMLKGIHAETTCATSESSSTVIFPSHPSLRPANPTDTPDTEDSVVVCRKIVINDITITPGSVRTTTIVPLWKTGNVPIKFYHSAFPNDQFFEICSSSAGHAMQAMSYVQAVQFLTETSTSYTTGREPVRTVETLGTSPAATVQHGASQLPTSIATVASAANDILPQPQTPSSQALQITLGDSVLPIIPVTTTGSSTDGTASGTVPAFVIGTQTIGLGSQQAATIGGTPIAIQTSNGLIFAVIGDTSHATTVQLSPNPSNPTITPPPIVVDGSTIPASVQPNGPTLIISGQTLVPGKAIILSNGVTAVVALATDNAGNAVLAAGSITITLSPGTQTAPIVVGSYTFTPQSAPTGFIISGQSLTIGGVMTFADGSSTKTLSLTTNSLGQTILINNGQPNTISPPVPTPLVIDGVTLSPLSSSAVFEYHISNQILTMGGTITIGTVPSQTILALTTNSLGQIILFQNGKPITLTSSGSSTNPSARLTAATAGIGAVIGSVMGLSSPAKAVASSTGFELSSTVAPTRSSSAGASLCLSFRWNGNGWMSGVWVCSFVFGLALVT
jgi:hypothetical protein